ncbi:hypothetical protein [Massilia litorea]|uniref:Uncharacterized protein n=1 Tax=Massilia litorea TaxID=2769491 RepID=A0A7L9TYC7_9BURK|nr:hypothetical protein [Massilia litorea]QOL47690.1 hypothetical protein LPB04_11630 [Massilia litorea]
MLQLSRLPWTRIERVVAALTIVNAALGLAVWTLTGGAIDTLLLALLGLLSGVLAWRGRPGGHGAGLAFYGVQLAAWYSYDATQAWHLRGAFSLAFVVHGRSGVLIVNAFALAMLAASAVMLWRRLRTRRASA